MLYFTLGRTQEEMQDFMTGKYKTASESHDLTFNSHH